MYRNLLLLLLASLLTFSADAQKTSWKKRVKEADAHYSRGEFSQAAEYYRSAYQENPKKIELTYKAGECFFKVRDYENASKCYEPVRQENKTFDKPGFKYALCLKQMGQFDKARKEFEVFVLSYNGADYKAYETIAKQEMEGCDLALQFQKKPNPEYERMIIEQLTATINSDKTEFGPIPFEKETGEVLYFSSNVEGTAKIYRIEKGPEGWGQLSTPDLFAKVEKQHYGNGCFTPESNRFYFTQCDILPDGSTNCGLYLIEKINNAYGAPLRLPDYVNTPGANTTHPYVCIIGDREVLFYSSNREGTRGGMDLWFVTKSKESTGVNFSNPTNLGLNVNTPFDEVTPFFDQADETLYFSSNGLTNIGGLDVFKSKGEFDRNRWNKAINMGTPINSPADDLYYTPRKYRPGGYLVSNRLFAPDKTTTTNDDIFYFGEKEIFVTLKGSVVDAANPAAAISDAKVSLYELRREGPKLVKERFSDNGTFAFQVLAGREYSLIAARNRYRDGKANVNTINVTEPEEIAQNISLEKIPVQQIIVPPSATIDRPYIVDTVEVPIDPITNQSYPDYSEEFKMWREIGNIAKKSRTGTVYYDSTGQLRPADPIDVPAPPVAAANEPVKGKGKPKGKDKTPKDKTPKDKPKDNANPEGGNTNVSPNANTDAGGPIPAGKYQVLPPSPDDGKTIEGRTYKIQVAAVSQVRERAFKKAGTIGTLEEEQNENGLTRVMVVTYATVNDARAALGKLINLGYDDAFIIAYDVASNKRVGEGFR